MSTPVNNTNNKEKTQKVSKFFKGVRSELKKVSWPSRDEIVNHTGVVVACCAVATVVLWVLDLTFSFGLNLILK